MSVELPDGFSTCLFVIFGGGWAGRFPEEFVAPYTIVGGTPARMIQAPFR
jgi:hypothetical protein